MPLSVNIPAKQENALLLAEIRPAKIVASLTKWHKKRPEDFASDLYDELYLLNRQTVSASNRLQALEAYLPYVSRCAELLEKNYDDTLLPFPESAKASANKAESLWLETAYGYKLVLTELKKQVIKFGTEKSLARAIYRAIYAISAYKTVYHQTYVTPPPHVWSDLHQLYFYAVKHGLHNIKIDTQAKHASAKPLPTIEDVYKHSLLLTLAEPEKLTQHEMLLVDHYLTHHIQRAAITAAKLQHGALGVFIIELDSDKAPTTYSKYKEPIDPQSDALLQTLDIIVAMHEDLKSLQKQQLPKSGSIPRNSVRNDYISLLTHLIKNLGVSPKRVFNRTRKMGNIELITGLKALHGMLTGGKVTPSRWDVLNISPNGMAVRRRLGTHNDISVRALVGIKTNADSHISIGIVRRASCGNRDRLDIGLQLISPLAKSVIAHIDDHNFDETILLLPEITAVNQPATIIAPRGTFSPARKLSIYTEGKIKKVILTRLIESTHLIERIQYSTIG